MEQGFKWKDFIWENAGNTIKRVEVMQPWEGSIKASIKSQLPWWWWSLITQALNQHIVFDISLLILNL